MSMKVVTIHSEMPRCCAQVYITNLGETWTCQKPLYHRDDHGDVALGLAWPNYRDEELILREALRNGASEPEWEWWMRWCGYGA